MTQKPKPDYVFNVWSNGKTLESSYYKNFPARVARLSCNPIVCGEPHITHRIIVRLKGPNCDTEAKA